MAKIDSEKRLKIPIELINLANINEEKIAICWDKKEKTIFIINSSDIENNFCMSVKKFDDKNRIIIPKDIRRILGIDDTSELIIAVRKQKIYILKA